MILLFLLFVWNWHNTDVALRVSFDAQTVLVREMKVEVERRKQISLKERHDYLRLAFPSRYFVDSSPLSLGD
jgi:hypothetical protein